VSKPLLLFPDPTVLVRDRLRELLAERPELLTRGVTVSTKPTTGADENRPRPYIHVMSLGGNTLRRVRAAEGVRLNVNDPDEGHAYKLAELARALLVASGVVLASSTARPTKNTDPDTGEPLASVDLDVVTAPN
jgi:hypothetical protein